MEMLWPGSLLLLGLIPLLIGVYIWRLRRRRFVVRYSSLSLIRDALPRQSHLRRHLPFALFLLGLASLVVALSRPVEHTRVPAGQSTIILALDVSRSMRQADVPPSRLAAAKDAALSFVRRQQPNTQIGVVAFSGYAELILPPTNDQQSLQAAIDSLTTGRRTAIGLGILEAVDAIAETLDGVVPVTGSDGALSDPAPLPEGSYIPAIIVLLTDGVSTTGPMPLEAAPEAAKRGIRIYTIGFGTEQGEAMPWGQPDPGQMGGSDPQGGQGFRGWFRRGIDEATLRDVAQLTGGQYYTAVSASDLQSVFEKLPTNLVTRRETVELSVLFVAIGVLLTAAAIALSMLWNPLP